MGQVGWWSAGADTLEPLQLWLGDVLPRVLAAGALLVVGWLLARLLRVWVARGVARLGTLIGGRPKAAAPRPAGVDAGTLLGSVVYWGVLLVFVTAATDALGLPLLAAWLGAASNHLPRVLLAVLIVVAGFVGGALARDATRAAARAAGFAREALLGRLVHGVIVVVALVTALDHVQVDVAFLTATLLIAVGALAGSVALAFALGARTAVSNIIACHYLQQTHRVGQPVRLGSVQGRIVEFTSGAVILDGPEGRVMVPAKVFSESVSFFGPGDER
jgi:small-conductance mechanosensitive channel